jgi:hypothetical protein
MQPHPAPGCCLITHEKKAYFWLETPEAADFSVSKQFQGIRGMNTGSRLESRKPHWVRCKKKQEAWLSQGPKHAALILNPCKRMSSSLWMEEEANAYEKN